MESGLILIVDDDADILRILKDNLELDNFSVVTASTGKEALQCFERFSVALMILDLSLPDIDGIQVCRLIRDKSPVPIIMLTARDRVPDKVLGLESGADDYIAKPFDYLELSARIRACLRRRGSMHNPVETVRIGDLKIDLAKKTVFKKETKVCLTQTEFNLLALLARNADRVMDRSTIKRTLWPDGDLYTGSRAIDVHVQHLRSKLEDNPAEPSYIVTVQGVGYMIPAPALE
ncbi:MAG TPA: response regulator transcription factor [Desulfomonilaceae bacterium]|nr:response regulator transcription factor [Desulfomonilaceae bacterium]